MKYFTYSNNRVKRQQFRRNCHTRRQNQRSKVNDQKLHARATRRRWRSDPSGINTTQRQTDYESGAGGRAADVSTFAGPFEIARSGGVHVTGHPSSVAWAWSRRVRGVGGWGGGAWEPRAREPRRRGVAGQLGRLHHSRYKHTTMLPRRSSARPAPDARLTSGGQREGDGKRGWGRGHASCGTKFHCQ